MVDREIHALVGENGAGKSTLMRILSGMFPPDSGTVEVNGADVTGWATADAIEAGVGMVHQHFMLVPTLTVTENIMLGAEITSGLQLDGRKAEAQVRALMERTGLAVPPRQRVGDLSVGEAQRVEILKALYRGARVLILDEPTAVLSPPEVEELWRVLRRLREDGGTIVLITHKLDEVMAISDTITVMRQGATVGRLTTRQTTPAEIARMMVGRDVALPERRADAGVARQTTAPLLEVRDLVVATARRANAVDRVSLAVAPGEIVGIAGVEGNGQTELIEAIAGLRSPSAGQILFDGREVTLAGVRERGDLGLAHIPEDRHERGLVLDYPLFDNLILGQQHHFTRRAGALDTQRIGAHAAGVIDRFDVRPRDATLPARALSGGNQQKIVIGREMGDAQRFRILLAAQPTRGVDVGAIEFIHDQLRAARAAGKAILLVSADLTEVLALSDRIAVMYGGRIVTVVPGATATAEQLGPFMTGAAIRPTGTAS
ncbi:MAG TPA: ABC transporter ATP-binding protein [Gemmatimonadaceae bacterium]|nr:ABC transporter ATP-binding protein [Gemmatimonadaceae bacterium]